MIASTGFRIVDIADAWPRFASRAQRSRTDTGTLDRVLARCRAGLALCLECEEGISVVTLAGMPGDFELKVLLAVSRGGSGAFTRRERGMVAVAQEMGARSISFRTDRPEAWARRLGPAWLRIEEDKFWREV